LDRRAGATASADPPPTPKEALLRQLQGQQRSLALINATVALVFTGFAVLYVPQGPILAWLAFLLAAQALRLVAAGDGAMLGLRLTLVSLLTGLGWGAMGWLFGTLDLVIVDAVVAFVLAGMAAGSITALPAHPPAFSTFLLATLLPFAVKLGLDPRPHTDVMALLTVLYFIGIAYLGHHTWRTQTANAGLFLRNQALVDSLLLAGQQQEARVIERTRQLAEANAQMAAEIRRRRRTEAQVRHLLHHDPLTNLPNRLVFADRLETALRRAQRGRSMVAVTLLDIDRFKAINDTLGHVTADLLLRALATRLASACRTSDTVARMGGDEFAAIFPDIKVPADAEALAGKLVEHLKEPFRIDGAEIAISASFGVALYPDHGRDAATLLTGADLALYDAKQKGRGQYRLLSAEMLELARGRRQIEGELEGAVERGELRILYQPQTSLSRNRITGAEALVRWLHPVHGLLAPGAFIPAAESSGLIREIDHWVLANACRAATAWQTFGHPVRVAVNLSPIEFRQPGLAGRIAAHLQNAGLAPDLLEIEITESAYLDRETASVEEQLGQIKDLGVRIAIDDFGTGYASLAYLRWLPIDVIKIDRSFVSGIATSRHDAAIVASTVSLADTLGKTVIAEGVETEQQAGILEQLGCDELQGYLLGRPASVRQLRRRLAA